ncbi:MAG TPA: hypothetical protein DCY91_30150 [Cyanobacteria bacterium UBA11370]|nr:hypothetical protein [Cyanobacteria bacterium UBA11370]HBY80039.1 hypothetical protein [Cyanobacteria bacterium UBA11148]
MVLSRSQQVQLRHLQRRFDFLEQNHTDVFEQLNYESNAENRNNLKRQLAAILQQMKEVEQEIQELQQGNVGTEAQSLIPILTPIDDQITKRIKAAYLASRPSGWSDSRPDIPHTIKEIIADLEDMPPGDIGYKRIFQFVARLVADSEIPQPLRQQLKNWLKPKVDNLQALLNQIKPPVDSEQFYLMVWIQPSQQKSDRYFVKAWLACASQPDEIEGEYECEPISISEEEAFSLNQIPQLLKDILIQSSNKCAISDLTIEFFLPRPLLNHEVDRWEIEITEDLLVPIGVECRVVIRSQERLLPNYCLRKKDWQKKWKKLKQLNSYSSAQVFTSADCTCPELYVELIKEDILGCQLAKAPELLGKESIFSVILGTAIPLALWVRCNLAHMNCPKELNRLLNCCIAELPTTVKGKRGDAFAASQQLRESHIGSHLSLLWEDPYRLPPSINYTTF